MPDAKPQTRPHANTKPRRPSGACLLWPTHHHAGMALTWRGAPLIFVRPVSPCLRAFHESIQEHRSRAPLLTGCAYKQRKSGSDIFRGAPVNEIISLLGAGWYLMHENGALILPSRCYFLYSKAPLRSGKVVRLGLICACCIRRDDRRSRVVWCKPAVMPGPGLGKLQGRPASLFPQEGPLLSFGFGKRLRTMASDL